ncbi:MAG: hypothetical protein ACRC5M_04885 [Anaeroplasmataceae bacterium]
MKEIFLRDVGGIEPEASDIFTDELITYVDGINTTLGTKSDPRFGEYQEFMQSIAEASILKIEPDQMSSGKYEGLDLTGDDDDNLIVLDLEDNRYFNGLSFDDFVKCSYFATLENMKNGISYDKDYCSMPDSSLLLPVFKSN